MRRLTTASESVLQLDAELRLLGRVRQVALQCDGDVLVAEGEDLQSGDGRVLEAWLADAGEQYWYARRHVQARVDAVFVERYADDGRHHARCSGDGSRQGCGHSGYADEDLSAFLDRSGDVVVQLREVAVGRADRDHHVVAAADGLACSFSEEIEVGEDVLEDPDEARLLDDFLVALAAHYDMDSDGSAILRHLAPFGRGLCGDQLENSTLNYLHKSLLQTSSTKPNFIIFRP